ncbi:MAG: aminodeoxychorismate synthase component I [Pirellulales bacterium]|nr:aminodeoxychorismate synthase component I [Pirellulales bacterium]
MSNVFEPLVEPLPGDLEPEDVFLRLAERPHCLFLDSAVTDGGLGRYSFVTCDPCDFVRTMPARKKEPDSTAGDDPKETSQKTSLFPFIKLRKMLAAARTERRDDLPPFQGGVAGLFSYDLGRRFEQLPTPRFDEFGVPTIAVGLYDVVVAFDHKTGNAWIISQGLPETEPAARCRRAAQRMKQFRQWLTGDAQSAALGQERFRSARPGHSKPLGRHELAPQFPVRGSKMLLSNFSEAEFLRTVERAIEYIRAGDVFQVNLAQRLLYPAADDPVSLYRRLRRCNPAPMAAYFDLGDFQIASASPERFLQVRDRFIETRPIKGTRPRNENPTADLAARDELEQSEKDRAENVMIVDLLRNDLSRICDADSVRVRSLCRLESFRFVHHLVSTIEGRLAETNDPFDALAATFPGGSVTGAPKIRAMEIIAELEPTARGAYCGSLGYIGLDGSMDLSILIRTITCGRGWSQAQVGGAIVAQSDPRREYEETWHKAEGLI